MGVAEFNDEVRILTAASKIAVFAQAQYKFGWKQRKTNDSTSGGLKLQCIAAFLFFIMNF